VDRELIDGLVELLDRRMVLELSVSDRHVYVTVGGQTVSGDVERLALGN
jgi:hypothetical protein